MHTRTNTHNSTMVSLSHVSLTLQRILTFTLTLLPASIRLNIRRRGLQEESKEAQKLQEGGGEEEEEKESCCILPEGS
jgi:hypothetical protein